ncbi:helix-turn-helix domain-containing protein [Nocardioides sp. W3-2-3]|nr:helix-turn-helix domain-containing protein [Nocardioides convexus]
MVHEEEGGRRPDAGAQTFARGLDVLAVVVGSERPLTITEVARESGLNRSIAYRLLRTLEDRGMVVQADGQGYRAGLGLLRLVPPERRILVEFARPALAALAARTGATAVLSVRDRHQEVVALCVPPPGDQPTIGLREGSASVLGRGVAATALLALDASGKEQQEPAVVRTTADLPPRHDGPGARLARRARPCRLHGVLHRHGRRGGRRDRARRDRARTDGAGLRESAHDRPAVVRHGLQVGEVRRAGTRVHGVAATAGGPHPAGDVEAAQLAPDLHGDHAVARGRDPPADPDPLDPAVLLDAQRRGGERALHALDEAQPLPAVGRHVGDHLQARPSAG